MKAIPDSAHVQVLYDWINSHGEWVDDGGSSKASLAAKYLDNTRSIVANELHNAETRADRRNPRIKLYVTLAVDVASFDEAERLADADWYPGGADAAAGEPMIALIPGRMQAEYVNGEVTKVWFSPAAGDPGYQSSSFFVHSGEYPDEKDDRPFWGAMEAYLAVNDPEWEG